MEEQDNDFDNIEVSSEQLESQFTFIDVSVQQRNNKKCWTVISNLDLKEDNLKSLLQTLKKKFSCNGSIDENTNIRLSGNHKKEIIEVLVKELNITTENIRVH